VNLNKIEKVFLILGITAAASILIFLVINDWMPSFAGLTGVFLLSVLIVDPLDSKIQNEDEKRKTEADGFGTEAREAVDYL
jgi:hypothetical protein